LAGKTDKKEDLIEALWALKREHDKQARFYDNMYRDLIDVCDRLDHIPVILDLIKNLSMKSKNQMKVKVLCSGLINRENSCISRIENRLNKKLKKLINMTR
jgi:F0F1-type ATP synthase delta subunit